MNRFDMMNAISTKLKINESITVSITFARGRTLNHYYKITNAGYEFINSGWNRKGNLREMYKQYVIGA